MMELAFFSSVFLGNFLALGATILTLAARTETALRLTGRARERGCGPTGIFLRAMTDVENVGVIGRLLCWCGLMSVCVLWLGERLQPLKYSNAMEQTHERLTTSKIRKSLVRQPCCLPGSSFDPVDASWNVSSTAHDGNFTGEFHPSPARQPCFASGGRLTAA